MAAKKKLEVIDVEIDFELLGIVSSDKPHHLAWSIQNYADMAFERLNDLADNSRSRPIYALFGYEDEENFLSLYLVQNVSKGKMLTKSLKEFQYLMLLKGSYSPRLKEELLKKLKTVPEIAASMEIPTSKIKDIQQLIFDKEVDDLTIHNNDKSTFRKG